MVVVVDLSFEGSRRGTAGMDLKLLKRYNLPLPLLGWSYCCGWWCWPHQHCMVWTEWPLGWIFFFTYSDVYCYNIRGQTSKCDTRLWNKISPRNSLKALFRQMQEAKWVTVSDGGWLDGWLVGLLSHHADFLVIIWYLHGFRKTQQQKMLMSSSKNNPVQSQVDQSNPKHSSQKSHSRRD